MIHNNDQFTFKVLASIYETGSTIALTLTSMFFPFFFFFFPYLWEFTMAAMGSVLWIQTWSGHDAVEAALWAKYLGALC